MNILTYTDVVTPNALETICLLIYPYNLHCIEQVFTLHWKLTSIHGNLMFIIKKSCILTPRNILYYEPVCLCIGMLTLESNKCYFNVTSII